MVKGRKKGKIPHNKKDPDEPLRTKARVGGTFLTETEVLAMKYMQELNSVDAVCKKLGIGRTRYYEIMRNIIEKWKMSTKTGNLLKTEYKTAKQKHNLLARHLMEVRRVEVIELEEGPPVRVEQ